MGDYVTEIPVLMKMECEDDRSGQISVGWGYKPSLSKSIQKLLVVTNRYLLNVENY